MNASMQAVRWVRDTRAEANNVSLYTLLIFLALAILLLPSQSRGGQKDHVVVGYGRAKCKVVSASGGNVIGEEGWNVI